MPRLTATGAAAVFGEAVKHVMFASSRMNKLMLAGGNAISVGRTGVLRCLIYGGPQTVPQLARSRMASRQSIQALVNALAVDAMVRFEKNPNHETSPLVHVTAAGERALLLVMKKEEALARRLTRGITNAELSAATKTLEKLCRAIDEYEARTT